MKFKIEITEYETKEYELEVDYSDSAFEDYWFYILRDAERDGITKGKEYSRSEAMKAGFNAFVDYLEAERQKLP